MESPEASGVAGASSNNLDWLRGVLDEVGLQQFYSKLVDDLQLTKLSHFDFVGEDDLIQVGLSRPAAKRLLAAIKKRKSFVNVLKNRIVNRLGSSGAHQLSGSPYTQGASKNKSNHQRASTSTADHSVGTITDFGRLSCLINSQDIQIKEEIGHGVHGFVKKGEWTTPNGRVVEVALKILKKDVMSEPGATFNDFVKEISVMHQLNHPNIIKLYGIVLSSPMMMVTELATLGNLRDRLRKENGRTPISQLISFGVQIASGMEYLESRRFVHRDLAARNIFISLGKKILIGDLGLMRAIPTEEDHYIMSEKTRIPYPWCAPESLRFKQFSSASDVYMFGVTLWEMFSFGKEPWAGLGLNVILENISTPNIRLPCPEACPTMVHQTLLQCWNTLPSQRPNFSTLYQYLSTSYPLEVRSSQHISELDATRNSAILFTKELDESERASEDDTQGQNRKMLNCIVNDRILVIDGQPEKYWWKGQNQRTYEIGWFPLCSTRWLEPKKGTKFISKPLKNSFIHATHFGPNQGFGNLGFMESIKNSNGQASVKNNMLDGSSSFQRPSAKTKTKVRLSKLFGISDSGGSQRDSPSNVAQQLPYRKLANGISGVPTENVNAILSKLNKSNSIDLINTSVYEAPLIDLSDEAAIVTTPNVIPTGSIQTGQQESLIDMNIDSMFSQNFLPRHSSETNLNRANNDDQLSWAGSWNTGTFDGSHDNIYSAYYCPQDAVGASRPKELEYNRYYSAVTQEEGKLM